MARGGRRPGSGRKVRDFDRAEARARGDKRYHGAPCPEGHGTERYVRAGTCVVCQAKKTADWRAVSADKMRQYAQEYRCRPEAKAARARSRVKYRDCRLAATKIWKRNNRERCTALQMKRYVAQKHRLPAWLTQAHLAEIEGMYHFAKVMQQITGERYHVDHIIPLQGREVSGLHTPENMQVITARENQRKNNRFQLEGANHG